MAATGLNDVLRVQLVQRHDPEAEVHQDTSPPGPSDNCEFTPTQLRSHLLYAFSLDGAGNRSDTATYLFYAGAGPDGEDSPGDLNGDGKNDIWNADGNGTLLYVLRSGQRPVLRRRLRRADLRRRLRRPPAVTGARTATTTSSALETDQNSSATPKPKVLWLTPTAAGHRHRRKGWQAAPHVSLTV